MPPAASPRGGGCDVAIVPRPVAPGFPIKLLNYMAAKCPCVMFRSSSSGLTHRENAYLASPDSSAALGEGIIALLREPALRREIAENASVFVREHNDRRMTAEKMAAIYTDLLDGRPRMTAKILDITC